MVLLMKKDSSNPHTASFRSSSMAPVKLEIAEDPLEEEHGPLNKRHKPSSSSPSSSSLQEWSASNDTSDGPSSRISILDEPSPLGLRLRKSPSLLDLIQMKLSQGSTLMSNAQKDENLSSGVKKESSRGAVASGAAEKLKASNFPASLLRIGSWEYKSKYEGDLVAKCYFAKHKLVWEVLEGGLKSKIEIQWSDIVALKAQCPENGLSTLTVVLSRQPLFFRETNPQPRKHTLWQAAADFTDGQCTKHRLHFLQCPQGVLAKHFEKLIQCDMRLNFLSQQPEILLDSPHFDTQPPAFEDPDHSKDHDLHQVSGKGSSSTSCFEDRGSPQTSLSSSFKIDHSNPSPSSVMDCPSIDGSSSSETESKRPKNWDQIKIPGLKPSMSMSDFLGHIELCLSEQMTSGKPPAGGPEYQEILEDIAQHLLNDNQVAATSDEKSLMSRVNSLCCLLQKDPAAVQNSHLPEDSSADIAQHLLNDNQVTTASDEKSLMSRVNSLYCLLQKDPVAVQNSHLPQDSTAEGIEDEKDVKPAEEDSKDASGDKQALGMSRKDSFSDLLLQLPRITSLPKFLFNISEEDGGDSQGRH